MREVAPPHVACGAHVAQVRLRVRSAGEVEVGHVHEPQGADGGVERGERGLGLRPLQGEQHPVIFKHTECVPAAQCVHRLAKVSHQ